MSIDNPIEAAESLIASDERSASPVLRHAKSFASLLKLLVPAEFPGLGLTVNGIDYAAEILDAKARGNRDYLLGVVAQEVKTLGPRLQKSFGDSHRKFLEEEFPGLVLDGLRKAEQTRAKERLDHLGRILVHAAESGRQADGDLIEEFMSAAVALSGIDVVVLEAAVKEYQKERSANPREAQRAVADRAWKRVPGLIGNLVHSGDDLLSIGANLEAKGFVVRVEMGTPWNDPSFRPLERGDKFVDFIKRTT